MISMDLNEALRTMAIRKPPTRKGRGRGEFAIKFSQSSQMEWPLRIVERSSKAWGDRDYQGIQHTPLLFQGSR